jgi:hypothetical protein
MELASIKEQIKVKADRARELREMGGKTQTLVAQIEDLENRKEKLETRVALAEEDLREATKTPRQRMTETAVQFQDAMKKVGKGKKVGNTVVMPMGEFKAEHKRLVKALTPAAKELAAQQKEMKMYGGGFFDALFERDPEKRKKIQEERAKTLTRAITGPKLGIFGYGKPPMKLVTASGKVHRGAYHMMADGSIHSGKTHTKRSMPLSVVE